MILIFNYYNLFIPDETLKLDSVTTLIKWYNVYLDSFVSSSPSPPQENIPWSKRLEMSQNVLFCEELFTQVCSIDFISWIFVLSFISLGMKSSFDWK